MKNILFFISLLTISLVGHAQTKESSAAPAAGAVIKFNESSHDFGDIHQGDKLEKVYAFQNSGQEPLIISEVITTCGCTATKWSKEPILPGKSGEILVTFNSEGKSGRQNKTITVLSNATNSPSRIILVTNVLPAK